MAAKLNRKALSHARKLIATGKVERDVRDDWSEHAPSADDENAYIAVNAPSSKNRPQVSRRRAVDSSAGTRSTHCIFN
ncbi:hypothetical protein ABIB27_002757 [Arthrobacter sp. UYEF21]